MRTYLTSGVILYVFSILFTPPAISACAMIALVSSSTTDGLAFWIPDRGDCCAEDGLGSVRADFVGNDATIFRDSL